MNEIFKNKKAIIFDMDGTLIDSMPVWGANIISVLERYNVKYPKDIIEIFTPLGLEKGAEYIAKEFGMPVSKEVVLEKMYDFAVKEYTNNIIAKDTVKETLITLKESGFSLNVLTASPHIMTDPCLKRNGLFDLFENVWSCGDFSLSKNQTEIYFAAAEKLGVKTEDCVFFDDNIYALKTAKKAGMKTVGVFDEFSAELENEIRKETDLYIYKFEETI